MDNKENKSRGKEVKKSFYTLFLIILVMITVTGGTYAYLAFTASDDNTIVGTTAVAGLDLKVERILPSNVGVMVPQLEEYLGSAISTTYSCIDGNGNTVCQVYKATITNTSTATIQVNGTIRFSGISNMPNLKWKRITDEITIGEYNTSTATTSDVVFESDRVLEKNASDSYYFVIWIDETGTAQTDSGTFNVTIEFNPANGNGLTSTITDGATQLNAYATSIMVPVATSDASLDFTQTSEATETNGVYIKSGTETYSNPIYYYRGSVNNNLIFADTCWKVVRTTETGGLKLLYNGVPSNGQCNNTGSASAIGTNTFNTNYNSPAYVGYMYGNVYEVYYVEMSSVTDAYVYGNSVTYSNGTYTLTNTISGVWSDVYETGLINNHYTCLSTGTTCENVYYISGTTSEIAIYMTLSNGKKVEDALTEMLDNNTTSSTIKGNNTTSGTLDYWYYTSIEQKGYSSYIEDTVWCNDRSTYSIGAFNPNGGLTNYDTEDESELMSTVLIFSIFDRLMSASPSLSCSRNIDKFTVNESNGNGALDYPVGLLTADEILLAGADTGSNNTSYYLYSGSSYWAGSPFDFGHDVAGEAVVGLGGYLSGNVVTDSIGVRPSVSLKPGFSLTGNGDGTATNPYIIS